MVLLYEIDGDTFIKRNVYKGKNLASHVEGFFNMRNYSSHGKLYQLIGKERKLLRQF